MSPWPAIAAATAGAYRNLRRGLDNCAMSQRRLLSELLGAHADSAYGRRYGFAGLDDPDRFRAQVPLSSYEALALDLQHQLRGESTLLAGPVVHVERTGGSSGGAKLIPYDRTSLQAFQAAIHPWLHDLSRNYPALGRGYFAVSPALRSPDLPQGSMPVGDGIYFGTELLEPLASLAVVPERVSGFSDMDAWQRQTLSYLLRAADLTFLSVWSPTFLTTLLASLPRHAEALLRELHDGAAEAERVAAVSRALSGGGIDTRLLWPHLQLISCWTHGSAARFVPELVRLFPQAAIQGKGLLSTEGVVSLPLIDHDYPVLAVNSGFHEFLDPAGDSHLAHELTVGEEYEVVMTVPGLYRYRCGDRVRARGWAGTAPQLEFIGRGGLVSDLVGEKLTEAFVSNCLREVSGFAMLAPALEPKPHYHLYVEEADATLEVRVERALERNPQYAYAKALGQISPLRVIRVERAMVKYEAWALARGQRLGDIKPPSLRTETDWEGRMRA